MGEIEAGLLGGVGRGNGGHIDFVQHCKMDKIICELDVITRTIHDREIQDKHEVEWKHLGRVLDRFFFFFTLSAFVLSSVVILLPAFFTHADEDIRIAKH